MYQYAATVERVVDGDTLDVSIDLGFGIAVKQRLRLANINAPEMSTPEGVASQAWLSSILTVGTRVLVETKKAPGAKDKRDLYGRYVATVTTESGAVVNQMAVDTGHAVSKRY